MKFSGTLGFIGGGSMAEAITKRVLAQAFVEPNQVRIFDPVAERQAYLSGEYGVQIVPSNVDVVDGADIVVFAVKPQVLDRILPELKNRFDGSTLVLSIMAGVRIRTLRDGLNHGRIVRSMPNTPAQVGKGMTVWTATEDVSEEDRENAQVVLSAMGDAFSVSEEHYLDMVTGLSGSGPGFVFLIVEAMIDAGVHIGLSRAQARRLVLQTVDGSIELIRQSESHPAELRNMVTSSAGTTAAGTLELERRGVRAAIVEAVDAAYRRSVALGDTGDM